MATTSSVNRASLLSALTLLSKIPARVGITSSEYYKLTFSKGQLIVALSAEVFGEQRVLLDEDSIKEMTFYVDRKTFEPFLAAFQNSTGTKPFLFTHRKKEASETLTVKCGVRRADFTQAKEVGGYGIEPKVKGTSIKKIEDNFADALSLAKHYGSQDPTLGELNGVRVGKNCVMASNKISAFLYKCKTPVIDVTLPTPFLDLMLAFKKHEVVFDSRYCKMLAPNKGYLCQILNEKANKYFPEESLRKGIAASMKAPVVVTVKASTFFNAAKRLNDIVSSVIKRDSILVVSGIANEKKVKLTCLSQAGEFSETIAIRNKLTKDLHMQFLLNLLLPLCDSSQVESDVSIHCDDNKAVPYGFNFPNMQILHGRLSE